MAAILAIWICFVPPSGIFTDRASIGPLTLSQTAIDFGDVQTLSQHHATLRIQNRCGVPVRITRTDADCVCLSSRLSKTVLAPFESIEWRVQLNTCDYIGDVQRYVWIETEVPGSERISVPVRYRVRPELNADPEFVPLGLIGSEEAAFDIRIVTSSKTPITLFEPFTSDARIEASLDAKKTVADSPATLHLRISGPFSPETFSGEVFIETTSPDVPRLRIPVFGEGGSGVSCDARQIDFGRVPMGISATRTVTFTVDPDLHLVNIRTADNHLDIVKMDRQEDLASATLVTSSTLPLGTFRGTLLLETTANGRTRLLKFTYRGAVVTATQGDTVARRADATR